MSPRATCPVCRRTDRSLWGDGRFRHHNNPQKPGGYDRMCDGTGLTLEQATVYASRLPLVYGAGPGFN